MADASKRVVLENSSVFEKKISRNGATTGQVPTLQSDGSIVFTSPASGGGGTDFSNTFADVYLGTGDGTTTRQNITDSFMTLALNAKNADPGNLFNTSTYEYNVPANGIYLISARIRLLDGQVANQRNFGMGVHTDNSDNVSFTWIVQTVTGSESNRKTYSYQRIGKFNANDKLRLYAYSEGGTQPVNNASMTIVRVA